jgi:hypothetical protein
MLDCHHVSSITYQASNWSNFMEDYGEWAKTVPEAILSDMLWKVQAYRLALFAADLGWPDVTKLVNDKRTVALSDQLYRALGSISANIAEATAESRRKIQPATMNMHLAPLAKAAIGTLKHVVYLPIRL